jgi:hypothetical protein
MVMRIDEDSSGLLHYCVADAEPGSRVVGLTGDPFATSEELHVHLTLGTLDGVNYGAFDFGPAFVLGPFEPPDRALHVLVAGQATELGQEFAETGNVIELIFLGFERFARCCTGQVAR